MDTAICCQFELAVAIVTACIPQVKIFIARLSKSNTSTMTTHTRTTQNHTSNSRRQPIEETLVSHDKSKGGQVSSFTTTTTVTRGSSDYWSEDTLNASKREQIQFGQPMVGRTRYEEAEEIYARLPTALPKSVPPWMKGPDLRSNDIMLETRTSPL